MTLNACIHASIPHAYIKRWLPGSCGNYPGTAHQKPLLPIWVTIDFQKPVTATKEFSDKFFQFLRYRSMKQSNVTGLANDRWGGGPNGYGITVQPMVYPRNSYQGLIDQANHHFEPDFNTAREFAESYNFTQQPNRQLSRTTQQGAMPKISSDKRLNEENSNAFITEIINNTDGCIHLKNRGRIRLDGLGDTSCRITESTLPDMSQEHMRYLKLLVLIKKS